MHKIQPRGRPLSDIATRVVEAFAQQPRTLREVAFQLQLPIKRADRIRGRLEAAGYIELKEKVPGQFRRAAGIFGIPNRGASSIDPSFEQLHRALTRRIGL